MKTFIIINTSDYNGDGKYYITEINLRNYKLYGVEDYGEQMKEMNVGDIIEIDWPSGGVYLMRVV